MARRPGKVTTRPGAIPCELLGRGRFDDAHDWLDPAEAIARQARRKVPLVDGAAHPDTRDFAIFTSGNPDFSTRRLMRGVGLTVR